MPSTRSSKKLTQRKLFDDSHEDVKDPPAIHRVNRPAPPTKRSATTTPVSSPPPKKSRDAATVTPEKEPTPEQKELAKHVPKYLHKNVEYQRKGECQLPPNKRKTYQWICERYEIPIDFEQKRSYGPLSGTTYEDRVIQAQALGKLERLLNAPDSETRICTECAEAGHVRKSCPTLI